MLYRVLTVLFGVVVPVLPAQITVFCFPASGQQEVPPNASPGTGFATVTLDQGAGTVDVFCAYSGLQAAATVAHLHQAPAGSNGGVIVPLTVSGGTSGSVGTVGAPVSAAQAAAMLAGNVYLNIHSGMFSAGEIRGQAVNTPKCSRLVLGSNRRGTFDGIPNVALGNARLAAAAGCGLFMANIGSSGQDGVQQVLPPNTQLMVTGLACPNFLQSVQGTKMTVQMLAPVPGGLFSIMTAENLDGQTMQVTADFSPIGATRYTVVLRLNGAEVQRLTGLPNGIVKQPKDDLEEACCDINGNITYVKTSGGPVTVAGVTVIADAVEFMAENPTAPLPQTQTSIVTMVQNTGPLEMTFQYAGPRAPGKYSPFGQGCRGTVGVPTHAGVGPTPRIGGPLQFDTTNLPPGTPAVLHIGPTQGILDLTPLGATNCIAWVGLPGSVFVGMPNPAGTATFTASVPTDPSLVGASVVTSAFNLDAGANPAGLTTSNGVVSVIGAS